MKNCILIVLFLQVCFAFGQEKKLSDSVPLKSPPIRFVQRCLSPNAKYKKEVYVVDGKIIHKGDKMTLTAEAIDSVYVLRDEYSKYFDRPIIIIRTKKAPESSKMKENKN